MNYAVRQEAAALILICAKAREMTASAVSDAPLSYRTLPADVVFREKRVAEFFAGIGLVGLGLESAGWRMAFANDIDPQKQELFCEHFKTDKGKYLVEDVHRLGTQIARIPTVALATASFPCNDLSLAGSRSGLSGTQSSAFWGFIDVLRGLELRRPPLVMLENVVGFLSSHGGKDFEMALLALNNLGYSVDALIIDAVRFVPQSRQRLFVIGLRDTALRAAERPMELLESDVRPAALARFIQDHPRIDWRLRVLPRLPTSDTRLQDIVEDLPDEAPEWWSASPAIFLLN